MKFRILGILPVLLLALAFYATGCEPYHRHGVLLEVDIHSKNYHKKHKDHGDHHDRDDDHHDRDHDHD